MADQTELFGRLFGDEVSAALEEVPPDFRIVVRQDRPIGAGAADLARGGGGSSCSYFPGIPVNPGLATRPGWDQNGDQKGKAPQKG